MVDFQPLNGYNAHMKKRSITAAILEALNDTPVVMLNGARQTGKSTLVQEIAKKDFVAKYITLDDFSTLSAALSDPSGFLQGFGTPLIIDEIQKAPDLVTAIKSVIDKDRKPGQYLLTGSANVLLVPKISESLAGRMEIINLWPFSQSELENSDVNFIDRLFLSSGEVNDWKAEYQTDIWGRVSLGGYPEVLSRTLNKRQDAWFESYVVTILQRDIRDMANIEGLSEMPLLLKLLALRSASLLNYAELSRTTGIKQTTLKRYMTLLEAAFLIYTLKPWSANPGKRLVRSPKIFLTDTGLLSSLTGFDADNMVRQMELAGRLLENFVLMEIVKHISWSETKPAFYHYRTSNGSEVDIVLQNKAGDIVCIEVKSAMTLGKKDFDGLRTFSEAYEKNFRTGLILYPGREFVPFGKDLYIMPISFLWK